MSNLVWDSTDKSIKGSFVNLFITVIYIILIILASVFTEIAKNLREIESFLIGFFAASLGIWSGKKSIEMWRSKSPITGPTGPTGPTGRTGRTGRTGPIGIPGTQTEGVIVSGKSDPKQDEHTIACENQ